MKERDKQDGDYVKADKWPEENQRTVTVIQPASNPDRLSLEHQCSERDRGREFWVRL